MSKHTPGPWEVAYPFGNEGMPAITWRVVTDGIKSHINTDTWIMAQTSDGDDTGVVAGVVDPANAHMLASALRLKAENERLKEINAAMLEALEFICDRYSNPPTAQDTRPNIYTLAKAAISKARGKAA